MNEKTAPILVSACLAGYACRYDGLAKHCPKVMDLVKEGKAIPFCPEVSGGLPTPRFPAEILRGAGPDVLAGKCVVVDLRGRDVTPAYLRGAKNGLELAERLNISKAILKDKSPACGVHYIYDGTHQHRLRPGQGVMAAKLTDAGIRVESEK